MSTTAAPARWQASSARSPSSVKAPSASRVSAPPGPSSVPSRSTYRQRTPALWRSAREDRERARAEQAPVVVARPRPDARPHEPAIRAGTQVARPAGEPPALRQLESVVSRPAAEDLVAVAEELHVVVVGAGDRVPAQQRRGGNARARQRADQ